VLISLIIGVVLMFQSCTKESSSDAPSSDIVYLQNIELNKMTQNAACLKEIDQAISNHELLYSKNGYNYYATVDLFVSSDGSMGCIGKKCGRFEGSLESSKTGYQILDDNTICYIDVSIFYDETITNKQYTKYKTLYQGVNLKSVSYYIKRIYYTYVKQGNKIVTTTGTVFTLTSDGLIKDGTSIPYVKFDLKTLN